MIDKRLNVLQHLFIHKTLDVSYSAVSLVYSFSLPPDSLRQGVSGPENQRARQEQALCHEGAQEGLHRPQKENNRAHPHRATGS